MLKGNLKEGRQCDSTVLTTTVGLGTSIHFPCVPSPLCILDAPLASATSCACFAGLFGEITEILTPEWFEPLVTLLFSGWVVLPVHSGLQWERGVPKSAHTCSSLLPLYRSNPVSCWWSRSINLRRWAASCLLVSRYKSYEVYIVAVGLFQWVLYCISRPLWETRISNIWVESCGDTKPHREILGMISEATPVSLPGSQTYVVLLLWTKYHPKDFESMSTQHLRKQYPTPTV